MGFNLGFKGLRNLENEALRWYDHTERKLGVTLVGKVSYRSLTGRGRKGDWNEEEYYEDQEENGNEIVSVKDNKIFHFLNLLHTSTQIDCGRKL